MRLRSTFYDLEVKLVKIGETDELVFRILDGILKPGSETYSVKGGTCTYDQTEGLVCSGKAITQ